MLTSWKWKIALGPAKIGALLVAKLPNQHTFFQHARHKPYGDQTGQHKKRSACAD